MGHTMAHHGTPPETGDMTETEKTKVLPERRETAMPDAYARQHELEREMSALGSKRFREALEEARKAGREGQTKYGNRLMAGGVVKVSEGIKQFLREVGMMNGKKPIAAAYLRLIDFDVAALLGIKGVIDGISKRRRLQSVAVRIGRSVEDEVRYQAFARAKTFKHTVKQRKDPKTEEWAGVVVGVEETPLAAYVATVVTNLNKQTSDYDHKRTVLNHCMVKMGVEWDAWPEDHVAHLGLKLVSLVVSETGIADVSPVVTRRNHTEDYLTATKDTLDWIKGRVAWDEALCPLYQPMVVPPRDWEGPTGGGYLSAWADAAKVVKTRNRAYLEELATTDHDFVYSALNTIQKTPWRINSQLLGVMTELWRNSNIVFGKLPSRENIEKPPKPADIGTNLEAKKEWKRKASQAIRDNLRLGSRRLMVDTIIRTAEKFQKEEVIYFPHNLDFRGRVYSIPAGLCPQGHDVAKGLLEFAQGKPLGDQQAADWLAIHGANLWGYDKESLADRVKWVAENETRILKSAEAPLDCLWWTGADDGKKGWQFLAFCFEWARHKREGLDFVTRLPVALDGSCNGLQHFSAMLRDPVGGAAVNLIPSLKPSDIYQTVCDKLIEKLKDDGSLEAQRWLTFGITRKTTKRPVMVVPYGGTRHSGRAYVWEHVMERIDRDKNCNLWGDQKAIKAACNFLAGLLWDAIRETVVAARDAMDWLQKVSQVVSKEDKPLNWTAPSGFKVQQAYPNTESRLIKTTIAGQAVKLNLQVELITLDKRRQSRGISPNFVHSLDAAALVYTVNSAEECGIDSFAMIHDSYGTLAPDTDTLRECLRQSFCQMYQFDVLQSFADEIQKGLPEGVKLPPLPKKGTLDINQVLKSDFFFA